MENNPETWELTTQECKTEVGQYNDGVLAYLFIEQCGANENTPEVICIDYEDVPAFVAAISAAYNACSESFTVTKEEAEATIQRMQRVKKILENHDQH